VLWDSLVATGTGAPGSARAERQWRGNGFKLTHYREVEECSWTSSMLFREEVKRRFVCSVPAAII